MDSCKPGDRRMHRARTCSEIHLGQQIDAAFNFGGIDSVKIVMHHSMTADIAHDATALVADHESKTGDPFKVLGQRGQLWADEIGHGHGEFQRRGRTFKQDAFIGKIFDGVALRNAAPTGDRLIELSEAARGWMDRKIATELARP